MFHNILIVLITITLIVPAVLSGESLPDKRFSSLKNIYKEKGKGNPYNGIGAIVKKDGSIVVLDISRQDIYDPAHKKPVREDDVIYFTKIDTKGNYQVRQKRAYYGESKRGSNLAQRMLNYPGRVITELKNGQILVLGAVPSTTGGNSYIFLFNERGDFIKSELYHPGEDISMINPPAQLIKDDFNNVFVIAYRGLTKEPWVLTKLFPLFENEQRYFPEWPNAENLSADFTASVTKDDNIVLCAKIPNNINYKTFEIGYFVSDLMGKTITQQKRIKLPDDAYRIIKNCALPGLIRTGQTKMHKNDNIDRELIEGGMDISRIANNNIVLSVMAIGENDSTWIYQFMLDKNGELVKPGKTENIQALTMQNKKFPIITKTGIVERYWFDNYTLMKESKEQIFWGFDEDGLFYWESIKIE